MSDNNQSTTTPNPDTAIPTAQEDPSNGVQSVEVSTPERPPWLPEKFKTPEDLSKAYSELERKLGSSKAPDSEPSPSKPSDDQPSGDEASNGGDEPKGDLSIPEAQQSSEAVDNSRPSIDSTVQLALAENRALTDEEYKTLEDAGYSRKVIDGYVASEKAAVETYRSTIQNAAGGSDQYAALTKWASQNLNETEKASFNKAVNSGDAGVAQLAVEGLRARYVRQNGSSPSLVSGGGTPPAVKPFANSNEISQAFRDPRYVQGDPEYIKEVQRRMAATKINH